jgi:hypothetical protein
VSRPLPTYRGPLTVREETVRIGAFPDMVADSKNVGPLRFGLPRGDTARKIDPQGFSDHLPISVVIEGTPKTVRFRGSGEKELQC